MKLQYYISSKHWLARKSTKIPTNVNGIKIHCFFSESIALIRSCLKKWPYLKVIWNFLSVIRDSNFSSSSPFLSAYELNTFASISNEATHLQNTCISIAQDKGAHGLSLKVLINFSLWYYKNYKSKFNFSECFTLQNEC